VERYQCATEVLADLEVFPIEFDEPRAAWGEGATSTRQPSGKILLVAMLIGLGLISTAAIVNRVESVQTNIEVSFGDARYQPFGE
jgi:hypothetical protein